MTWEDVKNDLARKNKTAEIERLHDLKRLQQITLWECLNIDPTQVRLQQRIENMFNGYRQANDHMSILGGLNLTESFRIIKLEPNPQNPVNEENEHNGSDTESENDDSDSDDSGFESN